MYTRTESLDEQPFASAESASLRTSPLSHKSKPTKGSNNSAPSRTEKIVLVFLLAFIINGINGRKIMKSVTSHFDEMQRMVYYSNGPPTAQLQKEVTNKNEETAIIITSSWIPTHPSTYLIDMVLNSTSRLVGLSPTAPIFITIDYPLRFRDFKEAPATLNERIDSLEEYTINLMGKYSSNPRMHIIPNQKLLHIGGSVLKALNLANKIYPTVRYVYYLQHDFYFLKDLDHTALINLMDRQPKRVNLIRFPKLSPHKMGRIIGCGSEKPIFYNETHGFNNKTTSSTLKLLPTKQYSDNNHLARFDWYRPLIASISKMDRTPENPLQKRVNSACIQDESLGLYLYHEHNIGHLNGRRRSQLPVENII